jgi:lipid-binding SYLF domain-containing protein
LGLAETKLAFTIQAKIMDRTMAKLRSLLVMLLIALSSASLFAFEPDTSNELELDAQKAILAIKSRNPGIQAYFDHAAGYAVFPSVGKGGYIIGGGYGRGVVIAGERVQGYTTLTEFSVGAQIGGQKFAEFIFFKDEVALTNFKRGNLEFGANVSAVAITAATTLDTSYDNGVAVFTNAAGGLMAAATVGGQKFTYEPKGGE